MPRIINPDRLISMKDAQKSILSSFTHNPHKKVISITDAIGKVLAEPVLSNRTMPPMSLAGPDGIAVKSIETQGASAEHPIMIQAVKVNTGLPMPEGYDAVIAIEEVEQIGDNQYLIRTPVVANQNTVPFGTDVMKDQIIAYPGHCLTPYDVAACANYGVRNVTVTSWKLGIIPTGDEIIPIGKEPVPGQIIDTNSLMISGYLHSYGVSTEIYPILPDNADTLSSQIKAACEDCDMVLLFGGSSAGSKDYTVDAIDMSGSLLFHGVAMGPGKPVSCGVVDGKPVVGMPGPAVASLITFYQLIFPLLKSWGVPIPPKKVVLGEITDDITPFNGWDVFHLVNVKNTMGKVYVLPMERRFGQLMGLKADAILHIPRGSDGFKKGEQVSVTLLR